MGVHLRSLCDPIDTPTPQGMSSLQVLRGEAQLERALIAMRTKEGMMAAKVRGRLAGIQDFASGDRRLSVLSPPLAIGLIWTN